MKMCDMRKEDASDRTHFRSGDRVFCLNGKWYFQTRENDHGPYSSRETADDELKRYVSEMNFFDDVSKAGDSPAPSATPVSPDWQLMDLDDKEQRS